jgi:hypothetical protein
VPSISLLPVADYAGVFREFEQRTSLFSHTDVARALWGQMNIACSVSILKQHILSAYAGEGAAMQALREQCLHTTGTRPDFSGLERNSLTPVAEALIQGLLLASNRIHRVTLSLFGHKLPPPAREPPPPVATMPPYDTTHSPRRVQLHALPAAALPAAGVPGLVHAHELLHWHCGQDLQAHALLPGAAAWPAAPPPHPLPPAPSLLPP